MSPNRHRIAALGVLFALSIIATPSTAVHAGTVWYSDPGTVGTADGWASTLSFTDPAVTATVDVTGAQFKATSGQCMTTDPCGWWSVDDENGSPGEGTSSLANSQAAFTPPSVAATNGVTWTWRSTLCGTFPTVATPIVSCPSVGTVTINFDTPVTNAIVHINNLGGNACHPQCEDRQTGSFTSGYDFTLFSQWTLTSGQELMMLSGGWTTNITLAGDTIRNRFTPQGLGARVSNAESKFDDSSTFYDNGTGSGSFLVVGTYSQLTFNIDLKWALVNYADGTPENDNIPEGVSLQLSFYDGPLPQKPQFDFQLPSVAPESADLPSTGRETPVLAMLSSAFVLVGGVLVVRSRRHLSSRT